MNQRCSKCEQSFAIEARDLAFYDKVSPVLGGKKYPVPTPKLCPDCRQQRRMAFRNERKLYNRTCDLCQKPTITIYSPDRLFPVYCATCWWSDQWDPISYGQSYDLSRNFFAQWQELWQKVPKLGLLVWGDGINSDYTHDVIKCTNSYLIFDGEQSKDSFYGETFYDIKDCSDFLRIKNCELGYELINCTNCYNLTYSSFSENCSDSSFLLDCIGCKNCFGCANLQQKQFYLFNQPYSQEEYLRIVKSFELHNYQKLSEMKKKVETFFANQPRRAYRGRMNENSSGNNLDNSENTFDSFDSRGLRDSRFCTNIMLNGTDCYDVDGWGENTALIYNSAMVGLGSQQMIGGYYTCFDSHDIYHSAFCWQGTNNLFGCIGLKHKEYCVLNKQYSKEEYEALVPKIIDQMISNGEWADFFPPWLSPFGYNETVAQEFFPLTKDQAIAQGFYWSDFEAPRPAVKQVIKATELPDDISNINDEVLDFAIECEITGKLFRVIKPELSYYRRQGIPIPHRHPDQRHTDRQKLRPPRHLWARNCSQCQVAIQCVYAPERSERILCEKCYAEAIL